MRRLLSGDSLASNLAGFRELHPGDVPQDAQAYRAHLADDFVASQSDALAQLPRAALSQPGFRFVPTGSLDSDDADVTTATYSLTPLGVTDQTARFEVWLELVAAGGEKMVYSSLDVSASDPVLGSWTAAMVRWTTRRFRSSRLRRCWMRGIHCQRLTSAQGHSTRPWNWKRPRRHLARAATGWGFCTWTWPTRHSSRASKSMCRSGARRALSASNKRVTRARSTSWMHSSPAPPMSIRSSRRRGPNGQRGPAHHPPGLVPGPGCGRHAHAALARLGQQWAVASTGHRTGVPLHAHRRRTVHRHVYGNRSAWRLGQRHHADHRQQRSPHGQRRHGHVGQRRRNGPARGRGYGSWQPGCPRPPVARHQRGRPTRGRRHRNEFQLCTHR